MKSLNYEEITLHHLNKLTKLYIETFNAEPWNDKWTLDTAGKRLHQMINTEDFYGLCAYQNEGICCAVIGCMEQFYNGVMFSIREFWVKNENRGQGIGTLILKEFENRLKAKGVNEIILFTSKGDYTEHFYFKQGFASNQNMVFMEKHI